MLQANEQITRRLALLVVSAIFLNAVCILSGSASGDDNACAVISTAYAEWIANEGECLPARKKKIPKSDCCQGNGTFAGIPGQTGYDCLRSMPFRSDLAVKFIDEYMGFLQFHSTIELLKGMCLHFGV